MSSEIELTIHEQNEFLKEQVKLLKEQTQTLRQQIQTSRQQNELKDSIINKQGSIINKQGERIVLLEKHVLFLENKLRKYINENTPSSKKPDWDRNKEEKKPDKEKKPQGKPRGSNGGTRPTPEIDEEKVIRLDEYEDYLGEPIDYVERLVCEIPPPTKAKWTRYFLAQYQDPSTGEIITATDPGCPAEGTFGPNLRALITILREKANLSEQQTRSILESQYKLPVSEGTIEAELRRVANMLQPGYEVLGETINRSPIRHSDETGQSVDGVPWCLYAFSTKEYAYYFAEEKKRAEHIQKRLDDDWNKILNCDGHSIYDWYYAKQRCWSHGTRKVEFLLKQGETAERKLLDKGIRGTFHLAKEMLKEQKAGPHQLWNVLLLKNRLSKAIKYRWNEEKCQKVANYMKNGWNNWFTFMFVPGVEPTNNLNERDIRKHVMKRKISGAFRSEKGLDNHCKILSFIESWRKNGKNPYEELVLNIERDNSRISW